MGKRSLPIANRFKQCIAGLALGTETVFILSIDSPNFRNYNSSCKGDAVKEKAKQILKDVIKELDEETRRPESGSWKSQAEKDTETGDEETLRKTCFYLNVINIAQQAADDAIGKVLVGENILTPALVHKGWQFWKPLLVTEDEKKAIEAAVIRWSEASVAQLNALRDTYEKIQDKDDVTVGILFLASVIDIGSSCRRQLSADLKMILADSKDNWGVANE